MVILRDNIQGLTKPAITRLARKGGIVRLSGPVYEEIRYVIKFTIENWLREVVTITNSRKSKRITLGDLEIGAKAHGENFVYVQHKPSRTQNYHSHLPPKKHSSQHKKPHKFHPGTVARREINYYQKHNNTQEFPYTAFDRLVREIGQDFKFGLTYSKEFMINFQISIEEYIIELFSNANKSAIHAGRTTVSEKDIQFANKIKNN